MSADPRYSITQMAARVNNSFVRDCARLREINRIFERGFMRLMSFEWYGRHRYNKWQIYTQLLGFLLQKPALHTGNAESVLTDLGSCVEAPKEAEAGGDGS